MLKSAKNLQNSTRENGFDINPPAIRQYTQLIWQA